MWVYTTLNPLQVFNFASFQYFLKTCLSRHIYIHVFGKCFYLKWLTFKEHFLYAFSGNVLSCYICILHLSIHWKSNPWPCCCKVLFKMESTLGFCLDSFHYWKAALLVQLAQWYDAAPESSPLLYRRLLSWALLSGAASYHCACCTHGTAAKFFDYYTGMRV